MDEDLIHIIWKYGLLRTKKFSGSRGEQVEILHCGMHNNDAGPDFLNARIKVDGLLWVGNVEIHKVASDWYAHKHESDQNYDNVILHVVLENNRKTLNSKGQEITCIEIGKLIDHKLLETYNKLRCSMGHLPCEEMLSSVNSIYWNSWLERIAFERMEEKVKVLRKWLLDCDNDWEYLSYISLARAFGAPVNTFGMEWLARSLPLSIIKKCRYESLRVEALLFGQAGLLSTEHNDEYSTVLLDTYNFLKAKYGLKPISGSVWKFHRIRPPSFPTIRISQFASLLCSIENLFSIIRSTESASQLCDLFRTMAHQYWETHYRFGHISPPIEKKLGIETAQRIVVNAVSPLLFLYGAERGMQELK